MKLKVWLKSRCADKVLAPLRDELIKQTADDSTVMDIGCGTGDLLFKAATRVKHGLGVDLDMDMINYAESRRREAGYDNLSFQYGDARKVVSDYYDIATSTLCLHEVGESNACELLMLMANHSHRMLIADYTTASRFPDRLGIEIDELLSGHYRQFRAYRRSGEIPYYAEKTGLVVTDVIKTKIDGIVIWKVNGKAGL